MKKPKPFKYERHYTNFVDYETISIEKDEYGYFLNVGEGTLHSKQWSPELVKKVLNYLVKVNEYFDKVKNEKK